MKIGASMVVSSSTVRTVKVDRAIAVQVDLADDLGHLLVRNGRVRLAHHPAKLLGRDVATTVLVLHASVLSGCSPLFLSLPETPLRRTRRKTHIFVEAVPEDGNLLGAQLSCLGLDIVHIVSFPNEWGS